MLLQQTLRVRSRFVPPLWHVRSRRHVAVLHNPRAKRHSPHARWYHGATARSFVPGTSRALLSLELLLACLVRASRRSGTRHGGKAVIQHTRRACVRIAIVLLALTAPVLRTGPADRHHHRDHHDERRPVGAGRDGHRDLAGTAGAAIDGHRRQRQLRRPRPAARQLPGDDRVERHGDAQRADRRRARPHDHASMR